jgi:hypothetical protein
MSRLLYIRGPKGLIIGKKAAFFIATGGIYDTRRRWPCSTLWSRICDPYLVFLA